MAIVFYVYRIKLFCCNDVAAHVWTKNFWYDDRAVSLLVVFQNGGNCTAYGKARPIKCMDVFRFILR